MVIAREHAAGECSKAIDTGVERGGSHLRLTGAASHSRRPGFRGSTGLELGLELRTRVVVMLSDFSDERAEVLRQLNAAGMARQRPWQHRSVSRKVRS